MIARAILEEKKRTGSSRIAIANYIAANYPQIPEAQRRTHLKLAIRRLTDRKDGEPRLFSPANHSQSFKVSKELKDKITEIDKKKTVADEEEKPKRRRRRASTSSRTSTPRKKKGTK